MAEDIPKVQQKETKIRVGGKKTKVGRVSGNINIFAHRPTALLHICPAYRVPTLLVTKIYKTFPGLSMTPEAFVQDPIVRQRCLNIKTNSSYYGVRADSRQPGIFFVYTDKI